MPYNSATGVYTPAAGALTASAGQVIASATWNSIFTDLSTALTAVGQEVGTWVPVLFGSSVAGVQVYSTQEGKYIRFGRLCYVQGRVDLTTKGGTIAGDVRLSGFPFTTIASSNMVGLTFSTWGDITLTGGYTQLTMRILSNNTIAEVWQSGSGVARLNLPVAGLSNTSELSFSGIYETT